MKNRVTLILFALLVPAMFIAGEEPPSESSRLDVASLPDAIAWQDIMRMPSLERPFSFSFDLDLLAPAGTEEGNFAEWFAQYGTDKPKGVEIAKQTKKGALKNGFSVRVLPDDFMEDAGKHVEQARCSFYPEVYKFDGLATPLPNLLLLVDVAKNWALKAEQNPEAALDAGEKAVRLGRLLLQDELNIEQHLTGVACIRIGAEIMYDHGRRTGDGALTTLAQRAIGDTFAQRRVYELWSEESGGKIWESLRMDSLLDHIFGPDVEITDAEAKRVAGQFSSKAHPVLRAHSGMNVALIMAGGTGDQKKLARETFLKVAADPRDPLAEQAKWWVEHPIDLSEVVMPMAVIE